MMILRDDDGWARIGGSHSGRAKGMGVSGGERFGGCVLSLGMRGHVNRKVNLRGRGETIGNKSIPSVHTRMPVIEGYGLMGRS